MNKQKLCTLVCSLFFAFNLSAQCPVGLDAIITSSTPDGNGNCAFELEINYATTGSNNSSISFEVSICGGAILYTTDCFTNLRNEDSPFITVLSDPSLVAPCTADICVTYTAWNSPMCNGSDCTPANNEVPVQGTLPVELISFNGIPDKYNQVKLEWIIATEEENDYFEIERSEDGKNFEPIGTVTGNGNSSIEHYYSFVDQTLHKSANYYRLKQVDYDGSFAYSSIIYVKLDIDFEKALTVVPSVTQGVVELVFNELPKANALIEVFNAQGMNVLNKRLPEGDYLMQIDVSAYQPGVYYIRVPIGKEFVIKRFLKVGM